MPGWCSCTTRGSDEPPRSDVANAFGDRYVYSLCPSAPEAREYAVALCKDVTENYPVIGISLETPGFLPYAHGFHHEFALMKPNRWLDSAARSLLLPALPAGREGGRHRCAAAAAAHGARTIETYLASDFDFPDDMAEAFWLADTRSGGELTAFLDWRCDGRHLAGRRNPRAVRKDATVAVIPSVARPTARRLV